MTNEITLDENNQKIIVQDLLDYLVAFYSEDLFEIFQKKIDKVVYNYSKKLPGFIKYSELDDLKNIANIEFIETLRSWDYTANPTLWPFAFTRINGAMRDHIRYLTKADPSRIYNWVADAAYMYLAINNNKTEFSGSVETAVTLKEAMSCLSPMEKKIVKLKSVDDLTLKDIAKATKLSESQISRIYNKALLKLRKTLNKDMKL